MMTDNDYYRRKTEADFLEEEMITRKGCRRFIIIMIVLALMAIHLRLIRMHGRGAIHTEQIQRGCQRPPGMYVGYAQILIRNPAGNRQPLQP
jgi:hypothetical protein